MSLSFNFRYNTKRNDRNSYKCVKSKSRFSWASYISLQKKNKSTAKPLSGNVLFLQSCKIQKNDNKSFKRAKFKSLLLFPSLTHTHDQVI